MRYLSPSHLVTNTQLGGLGRPASNLQPIARSTSNHVRLSMQLHIISSLFLTNCCSSKHGVLANWTFWMHISFVRRDCTDFINALPSLGRPSKRHISQISIMHTFAANIYKRNLWTQYYPTFNSILLFNHWKEYRSITIYRTRIMDLWCGKSQRYPYFLILSFTFLFNVIFRCGKSNFFSFPNFAAARAPGLVWNNTQS